MLLLEGTSSKLVISLFNKKCARLIVGFKTLLECYKLAPWIRI